MSCDLAIIGLLVGFLIGLTGIGGGMILTPLLVYLGIRPTLAVGTDLVYGSLTKIVGAFQHYRLGHVDGRWVVFLSLGSIPGSLVGVLAIDQVRRVYGSADAFLLYPLGLVCVVSSLAIMAAEILPWLRLRIPVHRPMVTNAVAPGDGTFPIHGWLKAFMIITLVTVMGFVVGLTSVGSGSLFALALLLFSRLQPREVVGTGVAHAAILVTAAGLAHASIGTVDFRLAANLLAGSLPGVVAGSRAASIVPHRPLKLGVALLIFLGGLRLVQPWPLK